MKTKIFTIMATLLIFAGTAFGVASNRRYYHIEVLDEWADDPITTVTQIDVQNTSGTAVAVYSTKSGSTEVGSTGVITTGISDGRIEFWYADTAIDLTVTTSTASYEIESFAVTDHRFMLPSFLVATSSYNLGQTNDLDFTYGSWILDGDTTNRLDMIPDNDGGILAIGDATTQADVYMYSGGTSKYFFFDEGSELIDLIHINLDFDDDADLRFGTGNDITIGYDGSNDDLDITGSGLEIAFGADDEGIDLVWHTETSGDNITFDESEMDVDVVDVDIDLDDDADLTFGSSDDVTIDYDGTGNDLQITEADGNLIVSLIGYEANESRLTLLADQDDDATDGWELAASTTGTLTIGNDASVAGTFVDKLTITGSTGNVTLTGDIVNENADTLVMSTDDEISYQSNDGDSIIQSYGFEAKEGRVELIADQDDDATDGWELAASTSGTLTIGNDSSVAGTFVDKLTITGSTGNVTLTGDIVNENADTLVMSNDDILQFTSNDGNATIQVLGYEASNAVLSLDADEADDNADTWTFTVADGGAMTVANEGTATMTINEVVAFGSGTTIADAAVTDATPYALSAATSGRLQVMPDLTADTTINMPTEADGLYYEFIYGGAADDAQDWIFDTGSDTNYFIGGLTCLDPDDGDVLPVYSDGNSNSIMTVLTPNTGTSVKVWCDGTHWYVSGIVVTSTDTGVTFADQ